MTLKEVTNDSSGHCLPSIEKTLSLVLNMQKDKFNIKEIILMDGIIKNNDYIYMILNYL